jgi:anti-sigma regulatory factor (Ser/Thr protein kinase)
MNNLDDVFSFIDTFVDDNKLDEATAYSVSLALEELFTNMVKYNPNNPNSILITLEYKEEYVISSITDFDVEPFDILKERQYDLHLPVDKRPIGKLGIYLVKKVMDDVSYSYINRNSKITLIKKIGTKSV